MKKNILLFVVLVLILIGVALVIGVVPGGTSYHETLYTNDISNAANVGDPITVHDKLFVHGGLLIPVGNENPTSPEVGQIWLIDPSTAQNSWT